MLRDLPKAVKRYEDRGQENGRKRFLFLIFLPSLAMNQNWERRHPCRRVGEWAWKLAGKDAGAPSLATGSWPQCILLKKERGLSMNRPLPSANFCCSCNKSLSCRFKVPTHARSERRLSMNRGNQRRVLEDTETSSSAGLCVLQNSVLKLWLAARTAWFMVPMHPRSERGLPMNRPVAAGILPAVEGRHLATRKKPRHYQGLGNAATVLIGNAPFRRAA